MRKQRKRRLNYNWYSKCGFWPSLLSKKHNIFFFLSCRSLPLSRSLSLSLYLSLSLQNIRKSSSQHLVLRYLRFLRFLRRREGQNTYAPRQGGGARAPHASHSGIVLQTGLTREVFCLNLFRKLWIGSKKLFKISLILRFLKITTIGTKTHKIDRLRGIKR